MPTAPHPQQRVHRVGLVLILLGVVAITASPVVLDLPELVAGIYLGLVAVAAGLFFTWRASRATRDKIP
ncbi:MAG: hypothetical protein HZA93_23765 [Verrucomicrobia bacterium]|nr:hypothetical protein [Verrucomicrobiota bacterium]